MKHVIPMPTEMCLIVTYRCPMRCKMCNIWQQPTEVSKEITVQDMEMLPKVKFINITGGVNLTLFEAEQAAEVVRAAANTDINTIFGSVINENLNDEVIVTVIATGFDKKKNAVVQPEPVFSNNPTRRSREEYPTEVLDGGDGDSGDAYELPPFLRDRNF